MTLSETDLASRLESATGPSRKLDLLIMRWLMNIGGAPENALRYTESVDDALTCLPEGWTVTFLSASLVNGRPYATITRIPPVEGTNFYSANGATLALAILATIAKALGEGQ